jgi:hypothetical protein
LTDVKRAIDAKDIAAFDRGRSGDVVQLAKWRQGFRERLGLRLTRFCAEREDDGEFVDDNGGIFDKHRIGQSRFGGERVDADAELREEMFVGSVLSLRLGEVNRLAFDESKLALSESRAYGAGNGG